MKYVAEKGSQATYQFVESGHNCEEHLHLQCVKCGRIIHLECHFMQEILEHVEKEHGFVMQCRNSIVYGTCRECIDSMPKGAGPGKRNIPSLAQKLFTE